MPAELQILIRHLRRVVGRRELSLRSDRELLTAYSRSRDEEAFTALVSRHAALVAGVCRRLLRNEQDIEDVFQATFLVLSRKAGSVLLPESLASWLHRVAFRLALRSKKTALRQQQIDSNRLALKAAAPVSVSQQQTWELKEVLDHELARLPEACRIALILCYMEGCTRDQAALQSGWSLRTLDRRLEQGRRLLRDRLAGRGLDLGVVVLAAALSEPARAGSARLASAAVQFVLHPASQPLPLAASALHLANSALPSMASNSMRVVVGILLTSVVAIAGVGLIRLTADTARDPSMDKQAINLPSREVEAQGVPKLQLDLFGDSLPPGAMARLGSARFRTCAPHLLAYSAEAKTLFVGNQQAITLFDATTGRPLRRLGVEPETVCFSTAVSPDGKLAAIGEMDRNPSAVVFEVSTGRQLCGLPRSDNFSTKVAGFSPDGSLLATTARPNQIRLYNSRTGKLVRSLDWEPDAPHLSGGPNYGDVAFMPDGKTLLASTRATGVIRIFDVQSGRELSRFTATPKAISGLKLSPDGTRLAVLECAGSREEFNFGRSGPGKKIMILDAGSGRQVTEILGPGFTLGMAFTADGKSLFTGKDEQGIGIWDTIGGKRSGNVPCATADQIRDEKAFALTPDGKSIAFGGMTSIHVFDIATGTELESHPGHSSQVTAIALHPLDPIIATGGYDGRLLLWDRVTGQMLRTVMESKGQVSSVAYSADGRFLYAVALTDFQAKHSSIRCWAVASGNELWRLDDHPVWPGKLLLSPDGKMLAAVGQVEGLLVETATGKPIRTLAGNGERSFFHAHGWWGRGALTFVADGTELIALGCDKGIHRWDIATGEHRTQPCDTLERMARAVAFSPDRTRLVIGGYDDHMLVVDVATGKKIRELKGVSNDLGGRVSAFAFSPDGRTLAWGGPTDGIVRLVDLATGTIRRRLPGNSVCGDCLVFSDDGKAIVAGCGDGTALVWDLTKVPLEKGPLNLVRP